MFVTSAKKVLIVEDDSALRGILKSTLGPSYDVAEARDGKQALERFEFFRPDLVLLDLMLPNKDGFYVLKAIRNSPDEATAKVPVVVFSNLASSEDILKATNLKADAYFVKSGMNVNELKTKISEFLHNDPNAATGPEILDFTQEQQTTK
jgi:DNA-binding response OmpR family regulator